MKIWVGITDEDWFTHLSHVKPDEVNFWQPSGGRAFRALAPGEPFLFKLHSPKNFIVGGGFFVSHTPLPASLAWDAFGIKNGVASLEELLNRIRRYRSDTDTVDPVIGCTVLAEPFFLGESAWVAAPESWAPNIVQGKTYDDASLEGQKLWQSLQVGITGLRITEPDLAALTGDKARFGSEFLTRSRLGQGAFRVLVTDAYERRCAVTGEKTLPVLEAAHIKPYALKGPHHVSNGILLRSDLHRLFDLGYITITPDLRLEVSSRLKAEWQNGREYYAHHGQPLRFYPQEPSRRPSPEFLQWHYESRFRT